MTNAESLLREDRCGPTKLEYAGGTWADSPPREPNNGASASATASGLPGLVRNNAAPRCSVYGGGREPQLDRAGGRITVVRSVNSCGTGPDSRLTLYSRSAFFTLPIMKPLTQHNSKPKAIQDIPGSHESDFPPCGSEISLCSPCNAVANVRPTWKRS